MAYNLPPPWDSGYALPDNVRDEGLQRRAFVTRQMPRGTYDQPNVGTGGYAVPQYVMDEGYGQGTLVTKWAPSGSYPGQAIPNWLNARPQTVSETRLPGGGKAVTIQRGLAGIQSEPAMPEPIESYGLRAATLILGRVSQLPPEQRRRMLKAILDKVDPSLWRRAASIAERYERQGMPSSQALHQGLARAMSTGVAAEIILHGLRRSSPQSTPLLGLGCSRARTRAHGAALGLGDVAATTCPPPAGFTWVPPSGNTPGHWARLRVGQSPVNGPCGVTVTQRPVNRDGLVAVSPDPAVTSPLYFRDSVNIDAWRPPRQARMADYTFFPDSRDDRVREYQRQNVGVVNAPRVNVARNIPPTWKAWIKSSLTTPAQWKDLNVTFDPQNTKEPWMAAIEPWYQTLGITKGMNVHDIHRSDEIPHATVYWPDGRTTGLYFRIEPLDAPLGMATTFHNWDPIKNPIVLKLFLSKPPDGGWLGKTLKVFAKVAEVGRDVLEEIGDLTCDLISTPGVGSGVSGSAGAPPQVGELGVEVGKQICGQPPVPAAPATPVSPASGALPVAILAGAGGLALYLMTR